MYEFDVWCVIAVWKIQYLPGGEKESVITRIQSAHWGGFLSHLTMSPKYTVITLPRARLSSAVIVKKCHNLNLHRKWSLSSAPTFSSMFFESKFLPVCQGTNLRFCAHYTHLLHMQSTFSYSGLLKTVSKLAGTFSVAAKDQKWLLIWIHSFEQKEAAEKKALLEGCSWEAPCFGHWECNSFLPT